MTKTVFILVGGAERASEGFGEHLNNEIAKYVKHPKILSCFFSTPQEEWQKKAQSYDAWFAQHLTQDFTYTYAKPETFLGQVDDADVIYLHGGITKLLSDKLPSAEVLKKHFKGKVVIGSSAGANMLVKYFWSSTQASFGEGRGLVDRNIMVHYGSPNTNGVRKRTPEDWKREEAEFQKRINNEPITYLPEGEFITIEQNQ